MKRMNPIVLGLILVAGALLVIFGPEGLAYSVLSMLVGLVIVVLVGEPMVRTKNETD